MSGTGGVGAAGAGGGGGAGAVSGGQAVSPVGSAADSGDFSGGNGELVKSIGDDAGGPSNTGAHVHPMGCGGNMSTQNFIEMHNHSVQQVNQCQEGEMDLKKLIEMMMAIKLLQEMNKMFEG